MHRFGKSGDLHRGHRSKLGSPDQNLNWPDFTPLSPLAQLLPTAQRLGVGAVPHPPRPPTPPWSRPRPQPCRNLLCSKMVKETNREPPRLSIRSFPPAPVGLLGCGRPALFKPMEYSGCWAEELSLSGLAELFSRRRPQGLGKLRGSGTDMSSRPDPGRGARCLCLLMDVLVWGECIIEHRALSNQTPVPNGPAVSPWWEPQRALSQGEPVHCARPVRTRVADSLPSVPARSHL